MNFLVYPFDNVIVSLPAQVSSSKLPNYSFLSPLIVPEPKRSPGFILQPVIE
jgi:hypothetical protein